jgi:hypothetical protein
MKSIHHALLSCQAWMLFLCAIGPFVLIELMMNILPFWYTSSLDPFVVDELEMLAIYFPIGLWYTSVARFFGNKLMARIALALLIMLILLSTLFSFLGKEFSPLDNSFTIIITGITEPWTTVLLILRSCVILALCFLAAMSIPKYESRFRDSSVSAIVAAIWFLMFPIGVWFLQPRINRAYAALTADPPVEPTSV